jgi:hypothetical protein
MGTPASHNNGSRNMFVLLEVLAQSALRRNIEPGRDLVVPMMATTQSGLPGGAERDH